MFGLIGSDMRDGSKHISRVSSRSLNAVSVVDAALASLMVHIEVLQVVVKVD